MRVSLKWLQDYVDVTVSAEELGRLLTMAGIEVDAIHPVGEAWNRAITTGFADANPYDGIDAGKINLWAYDNQHASPHGYYLEALVIFGSVTGRDPRSIGENECSAFELGFSLHEVRALQQVAYDQLTSAGTTLTEAGSPPPRRLRCR